MYLNRKIDNTLVEWKNDPRHKPLLMRGARQVGKTTAVRRLAESFETFVEINLETDDEVTTPPELTAIRPTWSRKRQPRSTSATG